MSYSTAVEARGLDVHRNLKHQRNHILKDISFQLPQGSITGLLGPSGCGKTTLIRVLVGAQHYTGDVKVLHHRPGSTVLRGQIGYVTQAASIYEDLTAKENLRYFATLMGVKADFHLLEKLFIDEYANTVCAKLSGGQRNRVSLACALVGNPKLLVLDEPTVGLDPLTREGLWAEFHRLREEMQTTILVSSHVLDEAARCDNLLVMRDGCFIWQGVPTQILSETQSDTYDQAFLKIVRHQLDPDPKNPSYTLFQGNSRTDLEGLK